MRRSGLSARSVRKDENTAMASTSPPPENTPTSSPHGAPRAALARGWDWAAKQPPRRWMAAVCVISVGLLAFGMVLQHVVGLEPCPMCIVQRYALVGVAVAAGLGAVFASRLGLGLTSLLGVLMVGLGAFTAARQSWLQWFPPEVVSCGRDFYGMIESLPLGRAIPMIFRGSGDCSVIDWTFLGGTIANWSFLWFVAFGLVFLRGLFMAARRPTPFPPGAGVPT
jgi:disulfide bond formation protein DsbB